MDSVTPGKRRKSERVKTKMEYVPPTEGFGNPYVAFFPSGFDPLQKTQNEEGDSRTEFAAYRNPKPMSRQRELVVQTQEDVDFVGSNYVGEAAGWQPCDYLLGVFDKEKGSLKLMSLAGEKVFRMEPRVRGLDYGRVIDEEAPEEEGDTLERSRIKKRMLTEAFGTQRSRLRAARYERAQVKEADMGDFKDIENLFQEAARNDDLLTNEQALQAANSAVSRNIPPHDVTATTPQDAYLLDKMITPDQWEALATEVNDLKSAVLSKSKTQAVPGSTVYPPYVLNRLKRIRVEGDNEGNQRRAVILLYIKHLLVFHSAPHSVIKKAADPWSVSTTSNTVNLTESLGIPGPLVAKFLEIFTTKGIGSAKASRGCQRNKEHVELTISYVLVLGLIMDDFHADPHDLATELKMTVSEIRPHYQQLGCKLDQRKTSEKLIAGEDPNSGKLKWKVTLPVPLQFPKIVNQPRQRGRR
ncbi:unnamed protein product [Calypogeia fissa]